MKQYGDIIEKNGYKVVKRHNGSHKHHMIPDDKAIEIYNVAKTGMSSRLIAKEYKIDRGVVDDIKFCRRSYAFLQEKYDLEPLEKKSVPYKDR